MFDFNTEIMKMNVVLNPKSKIQTQIIKVLNFIILILIKILYYYYK